MNTINKQALLKWMYFEMVWKEWDDYESISKAIKSGRFDSPSDDRLRAALERILRYAEKDKQAKRPNPLWADLVIAICNQALSTTTEPTGPYTIRRNVYGHAEAIERDGYTVLHLNPGTERNEQEVEGIVDRLNGSAPDKEDTNDEI